jgi:hypothetical protein
LSLQYFLAAVFFHAIEKISYCSSAGDSEAGR